ncbi:flagellar hook-length control protein FliK [Desulfosporosinus sp. BG]|uniref:flagellar hook-length control protein FliK n=1 Tax=Desulfosporosinus sp. BG TaxID=1633135 RepID=UPI00083A6F0D|nr:flagellar hook-length control protein FliK [Desulfosporosinus sp. BG]ODA42498.1 Flagellar hook-length control protein FliK [Desulfosporosinus sp. BG]
MAGINVLSDTLKGGNKLEKTLTLKGKDVADSSDAAVAFAAMLGSSMNLHADSKGQNSSTAGQESEEKQSTDNPVQSVQNQSMLGYGNFALSFVSQPMLQSDLPAGKEANSGDVVSQGDENLSLTNSTLAKAPVVSGINLGSAMLNLLSLVSDEVSAQSGMTTPKPQGANPGITELDKYRQVIANLLGALSGDISEASPIGSPLSREDSENSPNRNLYQEMMRVVQGWVTATDDVAKDDLVSSPKGNPLNLESKEIQSLLDDLTPGIGTGSPALKAKAVTLLAAALNPILSQGTNEAKASQRMNEIQGSSEPFIKQLKETDFNTVKMPAKNTALLTNSQQKSAGVGLQEGEDTHSSELSGVKDVNNQNSSAGFGVASNMIAVNLADGKTVAIPVWEQISTVLREQVKSRSQDLKQLDIQLHPEDLGKIQINIHWENGRVHLQVHASEAATGQILQNQLSDLRHTLTSQGVNCGSLQMGQGGDQQKNPQRDASQRTFKQGSNLNEDEDLMSVTNPSLEQEESNRINVTA